MALRTHEIILREKQNTAAADLSWHTLMLDPNTASISVGTAADGTWSLSIVPDLDTSEVPDAVEFLREAGEADTAIASAWAAGINAALSSGSALSLYVVRALAVAAEVYLVVRRTAPRFSIAVTSPSSTATVSPVDSQWPIAQYVPSTWGEARLTTKVYVTAIALDSSGDAIPIDTAASITIRALDGIEQADGTIIPGHGSVSTAMSLGESRSLPYSGGLLGIEASAVTTPPTGIASLRFVVRPSDA